jgi:FkbM family methyltransferase
LASKLREARRSPVYEIACSSPNNRGLRLPFYVAGAMSSLDRAEMAPGTRPEAAISVPIRTLDDVLEEAHAPHPIDFLSIDVEGHEIEVMRGFNFTKWQPRLLLLEDHVENLNKHHYVQTCGYRLVRRTGFNSWYIPTGSAVQFGLIDRWEVFRKYRLALPFRMMRNLSRRLRQRLKNRMRRPDISN